MGFMSVPAKITVTVEKNGYHEWMECDCCGRKSPVMEIPGDRFTGPVVTDAEKGWIAAEAFGSRGETGVFCGYGCLAAWAEGQRTRGAVPV